MYERNLKKAISVFVTLSHIMMFVTFIAFYSIRGFTFEEMTTCLALMGPVFSGFTTIIFKNVIQEKYITRGGRRVSGLYVFHSFLLPGALVGLIFAAVFLKAFNQVFSSFEQFKLTLGLIEAAFAAYVGQFLSSLYK